MGRMFVYHERQVGNLCGVHCVNNLLQCPRYGPGDLAEIGVRLDGKEQRLLGGSLPSDCCGGANFDGSADGGNFSIQVLRIALARVGLKLLPAEHPTGRALMGDPTRPVCAFVVQRRNHWFALRATGPCWWDLDSLRERPKPLDKARLERRLGRFAAEGHSVFLVLGGDLPTPQPPSAGVEVEAAGDSNWHEAAGLLATGGAASGHSRSSSSFSCASRERTASGPGPPGQRPPVAARPAAWGDDSANPNVLGEGAGSWGSPAGAGTLPAFGSSLEGYQPEEVRAALALAGGNRTVAADVLRKARGSVERLCRARPRRLAQALVAAVAHVLRAGRGLAEAVAHLIAILSAPSPGRLEAAVARHGVDCEALANRLLEALSKKSKGLLWSQGLAQAATVAVDRLLALGASGAVAASSSSSSSASPSGDEAPPPAAACSAAPHGATGGCGGSRARRGDEAFEALDELLCTGEVEGRPLGAGMRPWLSEPGLKASAAPALTAPAAAPAAAPVAAPVIAGAAGPAAGPGARSSSPGDAATGPRHRGSALDAGSLRRKPR